MRDNKPVEVLRIQGSSLPECPSCSTFIQHQTASTEHTIRLPGFIDIQCPNCKMIFTFECIKTYNSWIEVSY